MRKLLVHFALFAMLAAAGGAAFVWSGFYDISATDQHLRPTYYTMRLAMERSVGLRAKGIDAPPLGAPAQLERGAALFKAHCVQCHGGPGVAPEPFALALRPLATPLARSGLDREPAYLFWVLKNGIKMTGMPAWEFRMSEEDLWATVAFVRHLPTLSPQAYAALRGAKVLPGESTAAVAAPDAKRGQRALEQYACVSCHEIPGVTGPEARVGPTLHGIGSRAMLAGFLPNSADNMALWIRSPRQLKPGTAMPDLGVSARDAADIAAHLATLR